MKIKLREVMPFALTAFFVSIVCLVLSCGSCTFTSEGVSILTGDYTATTLEHFTLTSENTAIITFSKSVAFPSLEYYVLDNPVNNNTKQALDVQENNAHYVGVVNVRDIQSFDNESYRYELSFSQNTILDKQYILSGIVKDVYDSTLSFTIGFNGFNARVPKMIFSEVSTEYSNPKTEFVEFYILEDGNLSGIMLQSASDGSDADYVFPSVEVKRGEYVVLHMRTVEEGAVNETGSNVSMSVSVQSSIEGRDLWIEGKETRLSKNDVLLLRERLNGDLLDALCYVDGVKEIWPKDVMLEYIKEATDANLWKGELDVGEACNVENITATRTLSRQNIEEIQSNFDLGSITFVNSKKDWIIVARSNLTPGRKNSSNPHIE